MALNGILDFENFKLAAVTIIIASYILYLISGFIRNSFKNLPPGPWGLPIVGYLPFLKNPPFCYTALSKKYGDIYGLQLGGKYVVVLNSLEAVKEGYSHPALFSRPPELFLNDLPDKGGVAMAMGSDWNEQRKFTLNAFKAAGMGKQRVEDPVQENIASLIKEIEGYNGKPLELKDNLTASIVNHLWLLLFGDSLPNHDPHNKEIIQNMNVINQVTSQAGLDYFLPWLKPIVYAKNGHMNMKPFFKKYNGLFRKGINKVMKDVKKADSTGEAYAHQYLKEINKKEKSSYSVSMMAGSMEGFFLGAADTTRAAQEWGFYIMAGLPKIQQKVHEEIDRVIGRERKIYWNDRTLLPYVEAVIMECQRFRVVAPIGGTRYTYDDIKLGGYDVPKYSTVVFNILNIHNDSRYWENPDQFKPERFFNEKGELVKPPAYMPFTIGKRNCLGEGLAVIHIFLYFVAILQKFEIKFPEGVEPDLGVGGFVLNLFPKRQKLRFIRRK